jgi:hypothetical protein
MKFKLFPGILYKTRAAGFNVSIQNEDAVDKRNEVSIGEN